MENFNIGTICEICKQMVVSTYNYFNPNPEETKEQNQNTT